MDTELTENNREENGKFKKGYSGNPAGRPEGSISVISALKKRYREDPKKFNDFIERYEANPNNEKHVTEMIDGKPNQTAQVEITTPVPLMNLNDLKDD
jgi:hypothetical protein